MGYEYSKDLYTSSVKVSMRNGKLVPCDKCHWKNVCIMINGVTPFGRHYPQVWKRDRGIFTCQDYTVHVK